MKKRKYGWTLEYKARWIAKNRSYYNSYHREWMQRRRFIIKLYKDLSTIPKDEPIFRL